MADMEAYEEKSLVEMHAEDLRAHMGLPRQPGGPPPDRQPRLTAAFFIERAPPSTGGARCKLPTCDHGNVRPERLRIALNPSMDLNNFMRGREGTADFYHLECFEEIADFSQAAFVNRVHPVTRSTSALRGIKGTSIMDGNYLVDAGTERLILQWKVERSRQIKQRDGVALDDEPLSDGFRDLLEKAGLPGFSCQMVDNMSKDEYLKLTTILAPNESDGPEDREVWNLFDKYLTTRNTGSLDNSHDLSQMLNRWEFHTFLSRVDDEAHSDKARKWKASLGPKALRALKRMSQVPMSDFQGIFLSSMGAY